MSNLSIQNLKATLKKFESFSSDYFEIFLQNRFNTICENHFKNIKFTFEDFKKIEKDFISDLISNIVFRYYRVNKLPRLGQTNEFESPLGLPETNKEEIIEIFSKLKLGKGDFEKLKINFSQSAPEPTTLQLKYTKNLKRNTDFFFSTRIDEENSNQLKIIKHHLQNIYIVLEKINIEFIKHMNENESADLEYFSARLNRLEHQVLHLFSHFGQGIYLYIRNLYTRGNANSLYPLLPLVQDEHQFYFQLDQYKKIISFLHTNISNKMTKFIIFNLDQSLGTKTYAKIITSYLKYESLYENEIQEEILYVENENFVAINFKESKLITPWYEIEELTPNQIKLICLFFKLLPENESSLNSQVLKENWEKLLKDERLNNSTKYSDILWHNGKNKLRAKKTSSDI